MNKKTPEVGALQKRVEESVEPHILAQITTDISEAKKNDQLNTFLSRPPYNGWIKEHPFAKGVKYIPIQVVETLLKTIFQKTRVEILDQGIMANSVFVKVRLHYKGLDGEWSFEDGLGAVAMQVNQGAQATDWTQIKSNAVQIGLPAAESYAIKDAAEKIGPIFGADLNRKDTIGFDPIYEKNYDKILGND